MLTQIDEAEETSEAGQRAWDNDQVAKGGQNSKHEDSSYLIMRSWVLETRDTERRGEEEWLCTQPTTTPAPAQEASNGTSTVQLCTEVSTLWRMHETGEPRLKGSRPRRTVYQMPPLLEESSSESQTMHRQWNIILQDLCCVVPWVQGKTFQETQAISSRTHGKLEIAKVL